MQVRKWSRFPVIWSAWRVVPFRKIFTAFQVSPLGCWSLLMDSGDGCFKEGSEAIQAAGFGIPDSWVLKKLTVCSSCFLCFKLLEFMRWLHYVANLSVFKPYHLSYVVCYCQFGLGTRKHDTLVAFSSAVRGSSACAGVLYKLCARIYVYTNCTHFKNIWIGKHQTQDARTRILSISLKFKIFTIH